MAMVRKALDLYAQVYEDLLAVPVVKGEKSQAEKFAGGDTTTTLEVFIPENGRGIQAATSHFLGTNFAKMFDISFEDDTGAKNLVSQSSWGLSTRSLGIVAMVHGDDKGLVLPPRVAPVQVIIVPIPSGKAPWSSLEGACRELEASLVAAGIRAEVDARLNYTPGWKYNWWEMKGVPLRVEVGPRDLERGTCRFVRRHTGAKADCQQAEAVTFALAELESIHCEMLKAAKAKLDDGIARATDWKEVAPLLQQRKLILAPWCETEESEEAIKEATRGLPAATSAPSSEAGSGSGLSGAMKSLCIPLEQPPLEEGARCFFTGLPAKRWALFGRSY